MFLYILVGVICFVAGALVYRNNTKKAEAIVLQLKPQYDAALEKIKELEEKLKS